MKVCLVVIFNHQFNRNLPTLRAYYRERFAHVRFLVPFYRGSEADVIPVFDSSATFQGYITQGRRHFQDAGFSHYVFIADDLLLNPGLNEDNLLERLKLGPGEGYLKALQPISSVTFHWPFLHLTLKACRFNNFVNAAAELPSREEAFERLARHGARVTRLGWKNLRLGQGGWGWKARSLLVNTLFLYGTRGVRRIVYPLAMAYSDFLVVPADGLEEFCHLCGVFAAMRIFVECAIPTALALAVKTIRFERETTLQGIELLESAREEFEDRYHLDLAALKTGFPADALYVHPIKLSRWRTAVPAAA